MVAAGDVARWPNARFDEVMRVEHWDNAIAMGTHAAQSLLAGDAAQPFDPIPWFWSDQYDRKIQLAGRAGARRSRAGGVRVGRGPAVRGALRTRGRVVGVLGMNQPAKVMRWRSLVEERASWDDALRTAAAE